MDTLRLEVSAWRDPDHWTWRLLDADGAFLADHSVALDRSEAEYEAYLDLPVYLRRHAAPDRALADEERLLAQVGAWLGRQLLGAVGQAILDYGTPVVVRVALPAEAAGFVHRPLELAHAGGEPLALQDVSLVFEVDEPPARVRHQPVGESLRMLALFSLPTDARALALRRERHALKRLVRRVAESRGLAIDLRVLQYGVTREVLEEVLEEDPGWDVVHFSGHGLEAALVLETADGREDRIPSDQVASLLRLSRGRLKLVTLSACHSAAATLEETWRWLGLQTPPASPQAEAAEPEPGRTVPAVARALVRELDCAVLGMRYLVRDEFGIALTEGLYERLLEKGQPLSRALQRTLQTIRRKGFSGGTPPRSLLTPALFGRQAAELKLDVPRAGRQAPLVAGLAYFEPEPRLFVGRVGPMGRAAAALAPESGRSGVLFYGMAGAGKTACAVELAHHYADLPRFRHFVWFKAPEEGRGAGDSLERLARALEREIPDLGMIQRLGRAAELDDWLPQLSELCRRRSLLLVLDNLESLLDSGGRWRDQRWDRVVRALVDHRGLSRTLLTSRLMPVGLDESQVLVEPIHALGRDETLLLARQHENLGRLLRGEVAGVHRGRGRRLVYTALEMVQGHPKLLELAEAQAADPAALEGHLQRAGGAHPGSEGRLAAFFEDGQSRVEAEELLAALEAWTGSVAGTLPPASLDLYYFLCALEESDRHSLVVAAVWGQLWRRLGRTAEPPEPRHALAPLIKAALAEVRSFNGQAEAYLIHPGVVETGRRAAGADFQATVDAILAEHWKSAQQEALGGESAGAGREIVAAGRSAAPYLVRLEHWGEVAETLEQVLTRDQSPATVAELVPELERAHRGSAGTDGALVAETVRAKALVRAGERAEAEKILSRLVGEAEAQGRDRIALGAAVELVGLLAGSGRLRQALALVARAQELARRAAAGPWTQLLLEAQRLQLVGAVDQARNPEVLAAVEELLPRVEGLVAEGVREAAVTPWNVRELMLDAGRCAAQALGLWDKALALNALGVASKQARGALPVVIATQRFNDYFPLLRRERWDEARELLGACREVFEEAEESGKLGVVLGALAGVEDKLGHPREAVAMAETALRYHYRKPDAESCAVGHFNLAQYLGRGGRPARAVVAHRLAALVIWHQTGSAKLLPQALAVRAEIPRLPTPPPWPESFDELCRIVAEVDGVRFAELFARLPTASAATGEEALTRVVQLL